MTVMRMLALAILAGGALAAISAAANSPAAAQTVRDARSVAPAQPVEATAQLRRPRTQLRVYRNGTYLPPNAVRECNSWLEQEFRPSGTVIVPRMRCRWVTG